MKLLTHNMLTSKCMKGVQVGYPLALEATEVKVVQTDYNSDFIQKLLPRLNYPTLYKAVESLGYTGNLPTELPENWELDEELMKKLHHALFEIDVVNGEMICPETGRKFPINNGIPNMLLNEDEV
ncbi:multifunctional methyltransferase subunit TRM112-like protein [Phymastichus coffea]|uniref:multifunctional methyltransferase subunit TRM112-like protein n=1 Tax=Phymastichus coffea TaxID=108790 RepID=UPI00273AB2F0|nr:multifunctional methyltransferase subunit TRM112-like protein [Phymastichus coffea]